MTTTTLTSMDRTVPITEAAEAVRHIETGPTSGRTVLKRGAMMGCRRRLPWLLFIVIVAVAVGCSDDDAATPATTSPTAAASTATTATTADPTTSDTTTSDTSAPDTTSSSTSSSASSTSSTSTPADQTTTDQLASGSGCTPDSDVLPDGRWFGFVEGADPAEISFDLACWFTGAAAATAAAEDGEESPPPNDYHIRNRNDLVRTIVVDSSATVSWLPSTGDPATTEEVPYDRWLDRRTDRAYQPGVWLEVTDGQIVSIEEQYVP